jgi:hypothetical protein
MHKNYVWLGFLAMIVGAVGWLTIKALYLFYLYYSLNAEGPVENLKWSVEQLSEDRFALKADYIFPVKDQKYTGSTLFNNDIFWNPWTADEALKVYAQKSWTVWYSSSAPQYSSLQKNFPIKEWASAGILWVLLLYFFGLGYYVANKKQ